MPALRGLPGAVEALRRAEGASAIHLILEPTAGYQAALVLFAHRRGWRITQVNPLQVRRWAQGAGRRAKTDVQDALLLAEYGERMQPAPQEQTPPEIQELDLLLRRRQDVEDLLQRERNRLFTLKKHPHPPASVRQSLERTIQQLEQELAQLEEALEAFLKAHPALQAQQRRLRSVPGVGARSVLRLLVLLYRFYALTAAQGTAKQLVAFLGLDPVPHRSISSVYRPPSISKKGDKSMRTLLYMAAFGGVSGYNPLGHFYRSLIARHKPKKVALVAAARKILVWAWGRFFAPLNLSRPLSNLFLESCSPDFHERIYGESQLRGLQRFFSPSPGTGRGGRG
ncbi:transposase [Caldilinea sp.]|uniref:IS110 family transposase n=2 Tax=Caldilinea TaxID=233191 RepID=UPI0021DCE13E|nr:transposase [Caldilinea sp.]GIV71431.1 MAG: IS110 family transposase [Caldilinea sp.]